jgi:branched-chain amino acid transport system substrate-binding protein
MNNRIRMGRSSFAFLMLGGVALCGALVLTGCNKSENVDGSAGSDTVNIGEYACLTGQTASFGSASHQGVQMAIDEANARGGILGKKIELRTEDDQSKPGEAATAVRKLISRDHVVALIGEMVSSRSLEAGPVAQQNKIPMVSGSTNPNVTKIGNYVFRVCFVDSFQGTVMAKFALNSLKKTRIAVLTDVRQDYSVGLAQFFKEYFTKNGGTVVAEQSYSSGDRDFKAQLASIKAANPEAIFVPGYYNEVGLIALQARELGIVVPLMGGDGWDSPTLTQIGGTAMEGNFFTNHFSTEDQSPIIQDFIREFRKRFSRDPDAMAALGYDAAKVLLDAMARSGGTAPAKVRDALAATRDFQGVTGTITIDENRNVNKSVVVLTIRDKAFHYVETIAP